jgi:hypothetical protein
MLHNLKKIFIVYIGHLPAISLEIRFVKQVFRFGFSRSSAVANCILPHESGRIGNKQTNKTFQMCLISMQCSIVPDVAVGTHKFLCISLALGTLSPETKHCPTALLCAPVTPFRQKRTPLQRGVRVNWG